MYQTIENCKNDNLKVLEKWSKIGYLNLIPPRPKVYFSTQEKT